jgi:DNA-binding XRE family transcriptional regulator
MKTSDMMHVIQQFEQDMVEYKQQALINLSKNVYRLRIQKGYSQNDLAMLTGISRPTITHIEKAKHDCMFTTYLKIAKALECDIIDLLKEY